MRLQRYPDATTINSGPVEETDNKLEKHSIKVRCTSCQRDNYTRVESKVTRNGEAWAVICCCFGSPLLSLLVLCMDGFREFRHFCPSCSSMIGTYYPKFSGGMMCLLILMTFGVVALQIIAIIFFYLFYIQ